MRRTSVPEVPRLSTDPQTFSGSNVEDENMVENCVDLDDLGDQSLLLSTLTSSSFSCRASSVSQAI